MILREMERCGEVLHDGDASCSCERHSGHRGPHHSWSGVQWGYLAGETPRLCQGCGSLATTTCRCGNPMCEAGCYRDPCHGTGCAVVEVQS
jgi:hypothetical protein